MPMMRALPAVAERDRRCPRRMIAATSRAGPRHFWGTVEQKFLARRATCGRRERAAEAASRVLMALTGVDVPAVDPPDFTIAPQATLPNAARVPGVRNRDARTRNAVGRAPPSAHRVVRPRLVLALTAVTGGTSSVLLLLPAACRSCPDRSATRVRRRLDDDLGDDRRLSDVGLPTSPGGISLRVQSRDDPAITLLILATSSRERVARKNVGKRKLALSRSSTRSRHPRFGVDLHAV